MTKNSGKGSPNSPFVTVKKAMEVTSLGRPTLMKLASESGHLLRFGREYRIELAPFLSYLRTNCQSQ